jgi:uncharacterized protein
MRILCLSDIHCEFKKFSPGKMPDADVCIIAGDITNFGNTRPIEVALACDWIESLKDKYKHILWIPGNHDIMVDKWTFVGCECLLDNVVTIEGLTFTGLSICAAYNMPELVTRWAHTTADLDVEERLVSALPKVDILVSHCPPAGTIPPLDYAGYDLNFDEFTGKCTRTPCYIGLRYLTEYIYEKSPKLVVCGHAHGPRLVVDVVGTMVIKTPETWTLAEINKEGEVSCL